MNLSFPKKLQITVAAAAMLTSYAFLDYYLPRYELVKISEISTRRFDEDGNFIPKSTPISGPTRDVEMILSKPATVTTNDDGEKVTVHETGNFVYINEDTGWGFPFYFKFDTADIQSDAAFHKGEGNVTWIKSYGWRIEFFSWFPNALQIIKYEQGATVINFLRYFVLSLWLIAAGSIWYWIRRIKRNIAERVEMAAAAARERAEALGDGFDAIGNRVDALANSEGVQTTRRRFWKIFGGWW
jgi:Protein of unknown function (DUF1523).